MGLTAVLALLILCCHVETIFSIDPPAQDFPHPVILLLGPTGVGKSSLANTLLGHSYGPQSFPVGHGTESFTRNISLETGHWLGDSSNQKFSLVDTPGTGDTVNMDCEHAMTTVKFLKEVIGTIDIIVLMFKGTNPRFDASMQKQLELFESVFGHKMWKNVVTEISFWQYTKEAIEEREKRHQNEELKHNDWNEVYQKKFNVDIEIPTIFIDPIYHASKASERESKEFTKWTSELWEFAELNSPYSCRDLCSAPESFFVGDPLIPTEGVLGVYQGNSTTISCYVWISGCYKTSLGSVHWNFNGKEIQDTGNVYSGEVTSNKFSKYMISSLTIENVNEDQVGAYTCVNTVGISSPVEVKIKYDSQLEPWSEWGACSKPCVDYYDRLGSQSRTRGCKPAVNGGIGCRYHGSMIETRSCAGDDGLVTFCPNPASWSLWTHWENCDHTCLRVGQEKPKQTRRRLCREGENSPVTCQTNPGSAVEERDCLPVPKTCPNSVKFGDWTGWSACSQECVTADFSMVGGQTRNRTCQGNLQTCQSFQTLQVRSCNLHRCPEHGTWQQWLSWTPCSPACGPGRRRRRRFCTEPRYGGEECPGKDREGEDCNNGICEDEELYKLRILEWKMNQPDLQVQITEDWIFLAQMETAVGYSARTPSGQHWRSPVLRFSFYEDVLDNVDHLLRNAKADRNKRSIDAAKGLEYYNTNMDESLAKMNKFADDLDDAAMKFGISGVVEGGLSIAAGIATGLGLILAPFTAGASIGLTIAGAALGVGAGLQGLVSTLVEEYGYNAEYLRSFENQSRSALTETNFVTQFLDGYTNSMKEAEEFVNSERGLDIFKFIESEIRIGTTIYRAYKFYKSINTGATWFRMGMLLNDKNSLITTTFRKFKAPKNYIRFSEELAGKQKTVPRFVSKVVNKLAKKEVIPPTGVVIRGGTKLAKGLSYVGSVLAIGFGIWDTIKGANKMKEGSKLSDEFRKVIEPLKKAKVDINKHYDLIT